MLTKLPSSKGHGCLSKRNSTGATETSLEVSPSLLPFSTPGEGFWELCEDMENGVLRGALNSTVEAAVMCRLEGENLHPPCACLLYLILHTHRSYSAYSKYCSVIVFLSFLDIYSLMFSGLYVAPRYATLSSVLKNNCPLCYVLKFVFKICLKRMGHLSLWTST